MKSLKLDRTDYIILDILKNNSRTPLVDIAIKVSMSPPAVKERITKLEEANIIKSYTIEIQEQEALVETYILVKTLNCIPLENHCKSLDFIKEIKRLSGDYNYLLKLQTVLLSEVYKFQEELVKFGSSKAHVVTKNIK